jgi:hypothetical protein
MARLDSHAPRRVVPAQVRVGAVRSDEVILWTCSLATLGLGPYSPRDGVGHRVNGWIAHPSLRLVNAIVQSNKVCNRVAISGNV